MSFAEGHTRKDLDTDKGLMHILVREIEIIGEAATKISKETQDQIELPWSAIISMRNRLIHVYFDINLDILWNTVENRLPELIYELEKVLNTK